MALGGEALDAGEELPQTLRLLVRRLKRGRLNADINVSNLGQLSKALERAAVTLAIAIVTAAFALGLAPYLMHSSLRLWGIPLFPLLGAQPAWPAWCSWRCGCGADAFGVIR